MRKKLDPKRLLEAAQPSMRYLLRIPGEPNPALEVLEAPFNSECKEQIDEFNQWNNELGIQRRSILRIMAAVDEVSKIIHDALTQPGELGMGLLNVRGLRFGWRIPETKEINWAHFNRCIMQRMIFGTLDDKLINNYKTVMKSEYTISQIIDFAAHEVCYTIQQNKDIPGIRVMGEIPYRIFMATGHRVFLEER